MPDGRDHSRFAASGPPPAGPRRTVAPAGAPARPGSAPAGVVTPPPGKAAPGRPVPAAGPPPRADQAAAVAPTARSAARATPRARSSGPYSSAGDMPLLTHEEMAAGAGAGTLTAKPPPPPPGGRRAAVQRQSPWRRVRTWVYITLGVFVVGPLLAFALGWAIFKVPAADDTTIVQTSTFLFSDRQAIGLVKPKNPNDPTAGNINRNVVTLDKVPDHVEQAVVAAEDRTFYSNPGFDFLGIARAVFNNLTGGIGGGSTITQQYVKVSTGEDQNSLWRKYKEIILSIKISKDQTKEQILENYLNTVYFGRGAYGIQAAAKAYFNEDVGQLTISQGALLAGMIQSPSVLEPTTNRAGATIRWTYTLDQMRDAGFITPIQRQQQAFPEVGKPAPNTGGVPGDDRFHIYQRAVAELKANGISQDAIDTEGLTVETTIDSRVQGNAVEAINKVMKGQPENLRTALVSIDPKTGAILAYYGGSNGVGTDYAGGYKIVRQPGSSFKPFVVAAALQDTLDGKTRKDGQEFGLGMQYAGTSPMKFPGGVTIANSDGDSCDQCNLVTAMTKSTNTVFYQLAVDVGPQNVIDMAHKAGIPEDLLGRGASGGISLGDQEVHVVDMASAYATFAANGTYHQPYIVSKVTAADGKVLLNRASNPVAGEPRFSEQLARNVTESMLDVAAGKFALSGGRQAAAKTGTAQADKEKFPGQNKDGWTVGYTPSVSTAVWTGTDVSDPIKTKSGAPAYGKTFGGPIWQQFMNATLKGTDNEKFSDFVPIGPAAYSNAGGGGYSGYDSQPSQTPDPQNGQGGQNGEGGNNGDGNNGGNGDGDGNGTNGGGNNPGNGGDNGGQQTGLTAPILPEPPVFTLPGRGGGTRPTPAVR